LKAVRRPVIAGNWKMHGTVEQTRRLIAGLRERVDGRLADREVVVAPPFTALGVAAEALRGSPIELSAQNVHWEPKGAFTGEISAQMLLEAGCRWVIVGHCERRQYFCETDATVNRRTRAALAAGLRPILCVGETLEERDAGQTLLVVRRQLHGALLDVDGAGIQNVCVAYEPVWAIGTGRTATPRQAEEVHAEARGIIAELYGNGAADRLRILYGGSVKPDNIDSLMVQADVDGALVGGASLEVESFTRIVEFRS
jgi:triosephosphate isomerase (TIM)